MVVMIRKFRTYGIKGNKGEKGSALVLIFINSDPCIVRHEEPRSEGKTMSSKDGSFTRKNNKHSSDKRVIQARLTIIPFSS
jgi:hypothetical protein